ncbi:MAG: TIGR04084 family radical SAM/SPASM domain-containing protein [Nitrososphaerota archaeon]|jgi:putative peptide-modifying radical SAM enzyme|nr:TIGR04084 family radical SAM/SPASM domain-containing protein [Nitrososphaerota archaeon]
MFFHVILTTGCNLQCRYCFGESLDDFDENFSDDLEVDYSLPRSVTYDVGLLRDFCSKDPNCVLTFYGGEPLMQLESLRQIMDNVVPNAYMMQSNGLLLDKLEAKYVNKFHTLLVSIDGEEALTDFYRGQGVFRKVIENLKLIKSNGFNGELIARVTVMEQTDIYRQVRFLLENPMFSFSSIHWQLNAGFWGNDYQRRNFKTWSEDNYIPGVRRLVDFWVNTMEQTGQVLKLYPILGIAHSLLHAEEVNFLRCGGGWANYAIQTDGYLLACPTMWGMSNHYLGHIAHSHPLKLKKVFVNQLPCSDCEILNMCGGRCYYANITQRWNVNNYLEVCNTVRALVTDVSTQIPRIKQLISEKKICLSDFDYIKYNGAEIIP